MCKIILKLTLLAAVIYCIDGGSGRGRIPEIQLLKNGAPWWIYLKKLPFVTRCRANDSNCLAQSTQEALSAFADGLPQYGVEPLEPSYHGYMDASSENLKLFFYDTTMSGLKTCEILKMESDLEKSKLRMQVSCHIDLEGLYNMEGQFLFLPMQGYGKYHINAEKFNFDVTFDLQEYYSGDYKKHYKLTSWTFSCNVSGKSEIDFKNLHEGNTGSDKSPNLLLRTNPKVFLDEACVPITEAALQFVVQNVNKFFSRVAIEELSLNWK